MNGSILDMRDEYSMHERTTSLYRERNLLEFCFLRGEKQCDPLPPSRKDNIKYRIHRLSRNEEDKFEMRIFEDVVAWKFLLGG